MLSAKHGLLEPDDVVARSTLEIDDQSAAYRTAWGEWVAAQLGDRVQLDGVTVEVHGGVDFAQPLRQPLARRGAALDLPLPGTWRDSHPAHHHGDDGARSVDAPVRAALRPAPGPRRAARLRVVADAGVTPAPDRYRVAPHLPMARPRRSARPSDRMTTEDA